MKSVIKDLKNFLHDFQLHKTESSEMNSKDLLKDPSGSNNSTSLLQHTITLNCLSGDIKTSSHEVLVLKAILWRAPNFMQHLNYVLKKIFKSSSLFTNNIFQSWMKTVVVQEISTSSVKRVSINRPTFAGQFQSTNQNVLQDTVNIYDKYCCSLVENGKFSIQHFDESWLLLTVPRRYPYLHLYFMYVLRVLLTSWCMIVACVCLYVNDCALLESWVYILCYVSCISFFLPIC